MIGKITGIVDVIAENYVIIDVSGVGYILNVSSNTLRHFKFGDKVSLFVETIMREDSLELFGFFDKYEQKVFLALTTVKGIGKRLALTIPSNMTPDNIANKILSADKCAFKVITGVGSKMSERIIVELKDKFKDRDFIIQSRNIDSNLIEDAVSALINLGINKSDAYNIVSSNTKDNPDITINELIRLSLKQIAK